VMLTARGTLVAARMAGAEWDQPAV